MLKQTAFRLQQRTSFDDLQKVTEDIPTISRYEVLIKVRGVSLKYRDIAIATSKYPFPVKDSVVPCSDAAGDVVQVGEAVKSFAVGDKVVASFDVTNIFGPQQNWSNG